MTPTPAIAEPTGSASNWCIDSPTVIPTIGTTQPSEFDFKTEVSPEPTSPIYEDEVEEVRGHGVNGATDGSTLDIIIPDLLPIEMKS